jgi:hypothetical protein
MSLGESDDFKGIVTAWHEMEQYNVVPCETTKRKYSTALAKLNLLDDLKALIAKYYSDESGDANKRDIALKELIAAR